MGPNVVYREVLHRLAYGSQLRTFGHRSVVIPLIDEHPFDKPHRCRAISAGPVDERPLIAGPGDRFQEAIYYYRVRHRSIER